MNKDETEHTTVTEQNVERRAAISLIAERRRQTLAQANDQRRAAMIRLSYRKPSAEPNG